MNYPTQSLQPGMSGDAVKQLQQYLISQGYSIPDGATGYYGEQTKSAVLNLQKKLGIDYSSGPGYWGPRTLMAIQKVPSNFVKNETISTPTSTTIPTWMQGGIGAGTVAAPTPTPTPTTPKSTPPTATAPLGSTAYTNLLLGGQYFDPNTGQPVKPFVPTPTVVTPPVTSPPEVPLPPKEEGGGGEEGGEGGEETTGNTQLDELYKILKEYISSNTLNPDIELTPADLQRFYDQATKEISPYYASQISAIQDDLTKNINILQRQYEIGKGQTEAKFRSDIATSRESAAGAGTIFSGGRGATERNLASLYGTNLESQALTSESQIGNALRGIESKIGTKNIANLGIPSFTSAGVSLAGRGGFTPGRALSFAPTGGVTGSMEYQQAGDIRTMQDLLAQEEIKRRSQNTNITSLFT